jgi:hypothetical protein
MGVKKEKNVLNLITRHLDKIEVCLAVAMDTIEHYLGGNVEQARTEAWKVDGLETEADEIRREVEATLYSGAFLPNFRQDIYALVEALDKIADAAEALCDMLLAQRPEIAEEFKSGLLVVARKSMESYAPLKAAISGLVSGANNELIREKVQEVGILESETDDLEWKLTRKIFSSSLPLANKLHLQRCLEKTADISDRAEDASDQLGRLIFGMKI